MRKLPLVLSFLLLIACGDDGGQDTPRPTFDAVSPPTEDMGDMSGDATDDVGAEDAEVDMYVGPSVVIAPAAQLRLNETLQLSASRVQGTESEDVTDQATWSVADESIATVETGLVTALAEGVTEITASFEDLSTTVDLRVFGTFTAVASGATHNCALTRSGRVACWGSSSTGAHGSASSQPLVIPTVLDTELRFIDITAGRDHTCGLTAAGAVWCWGDHSRGQLGPNATTSSTEPVEIGGLLEIESVSAGDDFTCALTVRDEDLDIAGSVYCWGDNSRFQLGLGQGDFDASPQLIAETEDQGLLVSAGAEHVCALLDRNTLRLICWGDNRDSQLGQAMGERSSMAVEIATGATNIAAGGTMTCFTSTALQCLGTADVSLGDAAGTASSVAPVAVETGGDMIVDVKLGPTHACYLTATTSRCWGSNALGQLGTNTQDDAITATEVLGMPTYIDIALGTAHSCAIGASGGAFCWGDGTAGQIGNGASVSRLQPTPTELPSF